MQKLLHTHPFAFTKAHNLLPLSPKEHTTKTQLS
jgi:hypothetical protein